MNIKVVILKELLNLDIKYKNIHYLNYDLYKNIPEKKYNLYSIEIKDDLYIDYTNESENNKNKIVKINKTR